MKDENYKSSDRSNGKRCQRDPSPRILQGIAHPQKRRQKLKKRSDDYYY